ncbi:MAG TPA: glycosyltransferase family 39 protein [Anaeromyxobacteraceae bacterium]|nr:glycosyltransferase family 39 protein [Anaeromyxobacteraceae bacterium]
MPTSSPPAPAAPTPPAPAPRSSPWTPERLAFALVGGSLALHVALAGLVGLSPQEAYYWQYARHPALSYFDHPPLAAWTIRLTTALLGDGERAVRLAAALHAAIFAAFTFLAGRRLFGAGVALRAIAGALTVPLFALGQTVITPDAPLLAGWAAALYFTARALDEERAPWLVAAGAAVGFAALGKYTGWLLAPQIFLALLLDRRGRRMLAGPWPWLALALAAALFSPVVVWNATHGWVSFGFQFGWRGATAGRFDALRVIRFLALQSAALTPLMLAALLAGAAGAARRWREPSFRLCALFALPTLVLFAAWSPFTWVKGNWLAPAWPSALLAAAAFAVEGRRRRLAAATLATAAAGSLYVHLAMAIPALPFPAKDDVTAGWKELAARVQAHREAIPGPSFVLGCSYKPASLLAYYLPGRPETYAQNAVQEEGLQYDFWFHPDGIVGREGIVVRDEREYRGCERLARFCSPLEELPSLTVTRGRRTVTTFRLWRCRYLSGAAG